MAKDSGVDVIVRSEISASKGQPLNVIFEFANGIDATHVMWVNMCSPFVRNNTIIRAARTFLGSQNIESLTAVKRVNSFVWDASGVRVNDSEKFRTDAASPVFVCTHAFHIWNRERMLEKSEPWGQTSVNDPYLFEIDDPIETLDIDTERDLAIAQSVGKALYGCLDPEEIGGPV